MEEIGKRKLWANLIILLGLTLAPPQNLASSEKAASPHPSAKEVTGGVHMYDEVIAACSPDGRWLAFEYHEINDPISPRVGIMSLNQNTHSWQPLLNAKPGRHLFAGDISWSPDSQWLALWTDYPKGRKTLFSVSDFRIVKVNVYTHEVVRLTDALPEGAHVGPTTAWLRSGLIVFTGMMDENIYGVSENGGSVRKLLDVPADTCGGSTNTLAVSPDEQRIAFVMESDGEGQIAECNALWIGDLQTGNLRRLPTTGLHPLNPFWLDEENILFSSEYRKAGEWLPSGIYSVSLSTGKVNPLLKGPYLAPFVCDSGRTLYFSWGPRLRTKTSPKQEWPTINDFYQFHIWKLPLRNVLR